MVLTQSQRTFQMFGFAQSPVFSPVTTVPSPRVCLHARFSRLLLLSFDSHWKLNKSQTINIWINCWIPWNIALADHFTWSLRRGSGVWMTIIGATSLSYSSASTRMLTWVSAEIYQQTTYMLFADILQSFSVTRGGVYCKWRCGISKNGCFAVYDIHPETTIWPASLPVIVMIMMITLTRFLLAPVHLVVKEDKADDFSHLKWNGYIWGRGEGHSSRLLALIANYQNCFSN